MLDRDRRAFRLTEFEISSVQQLNIARGPVDRVKSWAQQSSSAVQYAAAFVMLLPNADDIREIVGPGSHPEIQWHFFPVTEPAGDERV